MTPEEKVKKKAQLLKEIYQEVKSLNKKPA